jgi:hypothetical protein
MELWRCSAINEPDDGSREKQTSKPLRPLSELWLLEFNGVPEVSEAIKEAVFLPLLRAGIDLVVLRTEPRPGDEVRSRGKAAYVAADFGKDSTRCEIRSQEFADRQRDQGAKGIKVGLHLLVDLGKGPIERVNLLKMRAK